MEAFSYHFQKDYKNDPKVIIGEMKRKSVNIVLRRGGQQNHLWFMLLRRQNQSLPTIQNPPEFLKSLLLQNTPAAKHFRRNILKYNSAFQMTSFGADKNITDFGFLKKYKIKDQCYQLMGSLLPLPKESHKFVQIYLMGDDQAETQQRCANVHDGLGLDTVMKLLEMFH